MYAKACLGILCCLWSLSGMALTISLDVTMDVYEEYSPEDYEEALVMAEGWRVETNEYEEKTYHQTFLLQESDIPFKKWLGSAWIEIDKNFVLGTGIGVGDWDGHSYAELELPRRSDGKILPLSPITLEISGGDNVWGFGAQVRVAVFE